MIWIALGLGVAGLVGLATTIVLAVDLRSRFLALSNEAARLGARVRELQATLDELPTSTRVD